MKCNWVKKIITVCLTVSIISTLLIGCGASNTEATEDTPQSETEALTGSTAEYFKTKDPYTIKILMYGANAESKAMEQINAKLSEITQKELNADVEITMVGYGTYDEQLNMMLSSGEQFDLFVPLSSAETYYEAGQLQPIEDLLQTYGPNLCSMIDEKSWESAKFDNEIYGVPVNKEKADQVGFAMRKDICDELGIKYQEMSTLDDIHEALLKVQKAYPDIYPVVSDAGHMFANYGYIGQNCAGDSYNLTVTEDAYSEEPKIVSFFETDLFKDRVKMLYQWRQEGLIMPDASTNTEIPLNLVNAGKAFGFFQHMAPGWEASNSTGTYELVSVRYGEPVATTNVMRWYVPVNSEDSERAVAFLDMMYSNSEVSNLVVNGIEGEDYQIIDAENGIIDFPEGVDAATVPYSRNNWAWPNPQLAYVWKGEDPNIWDEYKKFNEAALVTNTYGFTFNTSAVINETTACLNVYSEYVESLYAGSLNPDEAIPILNEQMKKAGIDEIVKEKQRQIDEWRANSNSK